LHFALSSLWIFLTVKLVLSFTITVANASRWAAISALLCIGITSCLFYVMLRKLARINRNLETIVASRTAALAASDEESRRREEWLRRLLASLPDVAWTASQDRRIIFVSPNVEHMLGLSVDEVYGNSENLLLKYVHPDDLPRTIQSFEALFSHGTPFDEVFRFQRKDGHWIWLHDRAVGTHPEAGVLFADGVLSDITARKEAEDALQKQLSLMRTITSTAPDSLFMLDEAGRVTFINPAGERMLGYTRDELQGKVMHDVCHYKRRDGTPLPRSECGMTLTNSSEDLGGHEDLVFRKDGSPVDISFSSAPLLERGRVVGSVQVWQDITGRKQAERQYQSLHEQFLQSQKMEAVGRLAGGIAHDFNNLVQIINGYAELIAAEIACSPEVVKQARTIHDAGRRAARLTQQLLEFSRSEPGVLQVTRIDNILKELLKLVRTLVGENIDLTTRVSTGKTCVGISAGQLEQVILNLASNARDAMPEGGKLGIDATCVQLDEIEGRDFGNISPGAYVQISVSDTGCGMDAATMRQAFEPFFTTKERSKGSGLGLSTVYGIVTKSGGGIRIDSEPDMGTAVHICLPVAESQVPRTEFEENLAPQKGTEYVLLAEDEKDLRSLLAGQLTSLGYTVVEAGNGAEALQLATDTPNSFHLLVTDMIMPTMGGQELSEEIRKICPTIKVIQMSGYNDPPQTGSKDNRLDLPHLQKPFKLGALAATVRRALDQKPT
jgi:PAS domain S-box-containing protein